LLQNPIAHGLFSSGEELRETTAGGFKEVTQIAEFNDGLQILGPDQRKGKTMDKESVTEQICIAIQDLVTCDDNNSTAFNDGYARGVIWIAFKAGFISEIESNSFQNLIEACVERRSIDER
jgi:hypothetical protein